MPGMHGIDAWRHQHIFDNGNPAAERGARLMLWITLAMMIGEIVAGIAFNSMALLADGWHMGTHAFAIGLSAFAYAMARRFANDGRFAFGTWKIEILASFTSALFLLVVAAAMVWESVDHLLAPQPIRFREAMLVAALGLAGAARSTAPHETIRAPAPRLLGVALQASQQLDAIPRVQQGRFRCRGSEYRQPNKLTRQRPAGLLQRVGDTGPIGEFHLAALVPMRPAPHQRHAHVGPSRSASRTKSSTMRSTRPCIPSVKAGDSKRTCGSKSRLSDTLQAASSSARNSQRPRR